MKSLWANLGTMSVVTSVLPTELIKIFQTLLKEKKKAEKLSPQMVTQEETLWSAAAALLKPMGCQTHYKTWITPTSSQGRSQERTQKMDKKLSLYVSHVANKKKYT